MSRPPPLIQSLSPPMSPQRRIRRRKLVHFGFVVVTELEPILGDHPAVTSGPPISLGWNAVRTRRYSSMDNYEKSQSQCHPPKHRCGNSRSQLIRQLHLTCRERVSRLLDWGVSLHDMQQVTGQCQVIQRERKESELDDWEDDNYDRWECDGKTNSGDCCVPMPTSPPLQDEDDNEGDEDDDTHPSTFDRMDMSTPPFQLLQMPSHHHCHHQQQPQQQTHPCMETMTVPIESGPLLTVASARAA
ncbi:hypothetical protein IV203_004631 [Nitzschia inconspicua]|uniref:Uncharacterized protein n=1 Tax=Nitzschia inconspicua TaxID=303405 RepID=A0A9K3L5L2_9STRA|nr:hypothetical protein IV203_004631 [Nitzschia inconspicua]